MNVKENLQVISSKINEACSKVKRNPEEITILAVTKYAEIDEAQRVAEAGVTHFGENRDDDFLKKREALNDDMTWHFIGTLQSRKVRNVINKVDYLHSLDRPSLAAEIEKRANKPVKCFVQVNVAEEESKHGLLVNDVIPFIKSLEKYEKIQVVGLMTMAPHTEDKELIRSVFKRLRLLQQEVKALHLAYAPCTDLSMGMSNDYPIAIEEGATFIRLGRSLIR